MPSPHIQEALDRLAAAIDELIADDELGPSEIDALSTTIANLTTIISSNMPQLAIDRTSLKRKLKQIAAYTTRKAREDNFDAVQEGVSLRDLRNQLMHRGRGFDLPHERRALSSALWRALEASGPYWDPVELANLLAYCVGVLRSNIDPDRAGPVRVIKVYKAIFNTLEEGKQDRAVKELILRLSTDPRLRKIIERGEARR